MDEFVIAFQIHKANTIDAQFVAIFTLQRRAGEYSVPSLDIPAQDGIPQGCQPGGTVGVVKRNTVADLLDVCGGMKVVCIGELPPQSPRKQAADRSFACTNNAHDNQDHSQMNITCIVKSGFETEWSFWRLSELPGGSGLSLCQQFSGVGN